MRRLRILICVISLVLSGTGIFILTAKKSVALVVNGKSRVVETYSSTISRLLEEQHVPLKTHDQVISSSGNIISNHTTVTVRSAYQTFVTVNGITIPFWTVATSVDQLIGFFRANERNAVKITVNLQNIYDKLTGGLSINKNGPVTVIADGKKQVAPDGTLPASSILDSFGIVLGKNDRVTVEEEDNVTVLRIIRITHGKETRTVSVPFAIQTVNDSSLPAGTRVVRTRGENGEREDVYNVTVLRIIRITHGKETRTVSVPFAIQTVNDSSLPAGTRVVRTRGENGEREDVYNVTYADGKPESAVLASQNMIKPVVNQVVAVSTKTVQPPQPKVQPKSQPKSQEKPQEKQQQKPQSKVQSENAQQKNQPKQQAQQQAQQAQTQQPNQQSQAQQQNQQQSQQSQTSQQNAQSKAQDSKSASGSKNQITQQSADQSSKQQDSQQKAAKIPAAQPVTQPPAPAPDASADNPNGMVHATPEQARIYAQAAAAQMGWTGKNWEDLLWLWNRESGWRWNAANPNSDAYGIPQALPGKKMASAGANWHDDASVQIAWGLNYIKNRYGDPTGAVNAWHKIGWY